MRFILIDEERRRNAVEHVRQVCIDKPMRVDIKPYKKKRSGSQNNTMWMWYEPIAEHIGETPEELHEIMKTRFLGVDEKVIDGILMRTPKSTRKLTTKEMADFLNKIQALAINLGITLPIPDDYHYAMMG